MQINMDAEPITMPEVEHAMRENIIVNADTPCETPAVDLGVFKGLRNALMLVLLLCLLSLLIC